MSGDVADPFRWRGVPASKLSAVELVDAMEFFNTPSMWRLKPLPLTSEEAADMRKWIIRRLQFLLEPSK